MVRIVCAAVILLTAACAPTSSGETIASGAEDVVVAATALPTTQAVAVAPTVAPTAMELPSPVAPVATVTEVPTVVNEPTPEQASPAQPVAGATVAPAQPTAAVPTVPTPVPAPPVSTDSQEVQIANGAEVYLLSCARCHGANGGGEIYGGLLGVGSKYTTSGMIDELTNGHRVTFGFANELSADEIASVVAYVKAAFP